MKVTYYRDTSGDYHGITDKCPKGFNGVVFIGRGPERSTMFESVIERVYVPKTMATWVRVAAAEVPDEWFDAIGYQKRPPVVEPKQNVKRCKNHFKFKVTDVDKRYRFEILPSKRAYEVLVRVSRKLEAGEQLPKGYSRVQPVPSPVPEETKLKIWPHTDNLMHDPWFWPVATVIFVILWRFLA